MELSGQIGTAFAYHINESQNKSFVVCKRTTGSGAFAIGGTITIGSITGTVMSAEKSQLLKLALAKQDLFHILVEIQQTVHMIKIVCLDMVYLV